MQSVRRIGILGGTFDPVHVGHLVVASEVRAQLGLGVVLLMVAGSPWQKIGDREITPAADRLAMVQAAVEGVDGIEVSTIETARTGPTYTADTLAAFPHDAELFLVVGADVAGLLDTWVRPEEVRDRATLVVVDRPGSNVPDERLRAEGWRVQTVSVPQLEVSSSDLRARLAEGRPIDFLVPPGAIREIRERGLYARRG